MKNNIAKELENALEQNLDKVDNILFAADELSEILNLDKSLKNTAEDTQEIDEAIIEELLKIEPSSGEDSDSNINNTDDLSSFTRFEQDREFNLSNAQASEIGALDSTLLEYALREGNGDDSGVMIQTMMTSEDTESPLLNQIEQTVEAILPEAPIENNEDTQQAERAPEQNHITLRLSNATNGGKDINATDHYEINSDSSKERQILKGDALDINGVNDPAKILFKVSESGNINATLKSDWNSIKNIEVESEGHANIFVKNFVHSDITLDGEENSTVSIRDAKRGNIETGDGDDKVSIIAKSNGAGWSNVFDIDTNAGDDKIIVKGDGGFTKFDIDSGDNNDTIRLNGNYDQSVIKMGAGDDRFISGKQDDEIYGEAGNDVIRGGNGNDILYGGQGKDVLFGNEGADTFAWLAEDIDGQKDTVRDFNAKSGDRLDISDVLNFNSTEDDLIADFVRLADADKKRDATLEIRTNGEGDWEALATITRGAKLDSVENLVDDGTLII